MQQDLLNEDVRLIYGLLKMEIIRQNGKINTIKWRTITQRANTTYRKSYSVELIYTIVSSLFKDGIINGEMGFECIYNLTINEDPEVKRELLSKLASVGIITALENEFVAVEAMLENRFEWSFKGTGAGRRYVIGEIPTQTGINPHIIALALLPSVGTNIAAARATQILNHFPNLRHIIMCGIAGGVPKPGDPDSDVRLGDVVISDQKGVVHYEFIKQLSPLEIEERHYPRPPSAELTEAVRFLNASRLRGEYPWEKHLTLGSHLSDSARPPDNINANGGSIEYPIDIKRRAGHPRVFTGPIASANRLLRDSAYRDALQDKFGVKAVEMEGAGIADAAWLNDRAGYLVVRGICDYCDSNKGDLWQGYAALAAAAYVRALLESMPNY